MKLCIENFDRVFVEIDDIKTKLDKIQKRTLQDDDASNSEIIDLQKRVIYLEKQFESLQKARS